MDELQRKMALPSTDSEYMTFAQAMQELMKQQTQVAATFA